MNIVYIATSTIPSRTASSIHVMKMCQAFAQNGHEVTLIVPDRKIDREPGVEDVFSFYGVEKCFEILYLPLLPVKGKGIISGILAGGKIRRMQPDIIYGRDLPGCFFASLLDLPVVFESHAPIENYFYSRMFRNLIAKPVFQKLVVITHALKEYYSKRDPILSENIIVAPDGADPVPEDRRPILLLNKENKLQVGYVGHLYKGKGMEVISNLVRQCDWADFHIVGGAEKDISYWRKKTKDQQNIFFYGFLPHAKTVEYILAFDVTLVPNQKHVSTCITDEDIGKWTSPLKIFEYMAAGKAIICSDLPVLREVLENGHNALLCDPDDINSWKEALTFLSEREDVRIQLGENAKNDFIRKYSWYSRAEKILNEMKP
ncbi:glycosyltransferase [Methanofollis formosanus]|uniref:Glycosyltransferase n=1 Tax=Methanofollis formosanus TaxID=299308 RepID=A0A8G1A1V7_9EURY|nr:glycosyltransferase family 4 protein [Methanofollis formosanus]QYZ79864.1 glycosyltransferase [Methanofollis formosanus]